MTVADMISERTAKLEAIKDSSNAAVTAKGGTAAGDLSGLPAAIASIPSGGELPELTAPAEVGHVLAGKEYIDGNGDKKSGTLVVCDTVYEVETLAYPGTGLTVELESSADGSGKTMTLPEPNLKPENIVAGSSIFGVTGTAKKLRVETGSITPAEDTQTITIPITGKVLDIIGVSVPVKTGYVIAASYSKGNYIIDAQMGGYFRYASVTDIISAGIGVSIQDGNMIVATGNTARSFAAGATYRWTVYNWEDDV